MTSNELIQRYLLGLATEKEVRELETRLASDEQLQDEILLQAECDSHLRQEVQLTVQQRKEPGLALRHSSTSSSTVVWKWASGLSTLAATVLLCVLLLNFPAQKIAMAYPTLGHVTFSVPLSEKNIWAAAGRGDRNGIREELRNNWEVDARCENGLTPLHIATLFHQHATVELLLSEGANVSLGDAEGNVPLQMAAFLGHTDIVRLLLAAGADPAVRNHRGFNAMDLVALTWSNGLESFYRNVEKELGQRLDLARIQLERPKIMALLTDASPKASNSVPTVSIWQAAITGNTSVIEQHIKLGTDLNIREDFGGSTPLMLAAIFGQLDTAQILIHADAHLDSQNHSGDSALHLASFFCRQEIVVLLLKSGADSNKVNNHGLTPMAATSIEMNAELRAIYQHVYGSLGLKCDLDTISLAREQIAEILRRYAVSLESK